MELRLFVMSDLHAFDSVQSKASKPSFFDITSTGPSANDPIHDLKELIKSDTALRSDYLLFGGDLADCAYPPAAVRAWHEVNEIGSLLGCNAVFAAVGNHDVDSRYAYNDYDAKGAALDLLPSFPIGDELQNNHFWTHHFAINEPFQFPVRFVILNSSGYHGAGKDMEEKEYLHGRLSERTLRKLLAQLDRGGRKCANIALIHHHPQKQNELHLGDYDDMKGGHEFLAALDAVKYGPWLVIHGHKHFPKISYAQGTTNPPVVFSSGSCAAVPYPEIQQRVGQQVYLLTVDLNRTTATSCYGTFRAWDWAPGKGWARAQVRSGLPAEGGFGERCDIGVRASALADKYKGGRYYWTDVLAEHPDLKFITPGYRASLIEMLQLQFSCHFEINQEGSPILFTR